MADTLVKKPKLIVGTQAQVSAEMGANDIGFATDIRFYNATETDTLLASKQPVGDYATNSALASGLALKVAIAQGAENAGKILKIDDSGNVIVADESGGGASLPILYHTWSDHVINDISWLIADTFSWQSGDVYVAAYDHLNNDMRTVYAWVDRHGSYGFNVYTESATPSVGDSIYDENGSVIGSCSSFNSGSLGWTGSDETTYSSWLRSVSDDLPSARTETIGDITITYYLAQDGHKICLPDQESKVMALYEATGVAWYYLLDTTNKQFKLPRTNNLFKHYVPDYSQSKTISSGWVAEYDCVCFLCNSWENSVDFKVDGKQVHRFDGSGGYGHPTGAWFMIPKGGKVTYSGNFVISPTVYPMKSVSELDEVAGEKYLYFYVGNFEQSAIEQTAGITAETLNQKADIDGGNCSANFAKFGMPSEIYTNLTLGSSGSKYTAPADGWFALGKVGNSGQMINMENQLDGSSSQTIGSRVYSAASGGEIKIYLPARKGDVVYISYTASGTTNFFHFIYAEGAKHLA